MVPISFGSYTPFKLIKICMTVQFPQSKRDRRLEWERWILQYSLVPTLIRDLSHAIFTKVSSSSDRNKNPATNLYTDN